MQWHEKVSAHTFNPSFFSAEWNSRHAYWQKLPSGSRTSGFFFVFSIYSSKNVLVCYGSSEKNLWLSWQKQFTWRFCSLHQAALSVSRARVLLSLPAIPILTCPPTSHRAAIGFRFILITVSKFWKTSKSRRTERKKQLHPTNKKITTIYGNIFLAIYEQKVHLWAGSHVGHPSVSIIQSTKTSLDKNEDSEL